MHKKTYGILGAALIIIAAIAIVTVAVMHHNSNRVVPARSLAATRAHSPSNPTACLAEKDDHKLKVDAKDQYFITNTTITQIDDVPAGTNVDVHLKTYDGTMATGTSIYEGKYGSYNFTATKLYPHAGNTYVGGWRITQFEVCKR